MNEETINRVRKYAPYAAGAVVLVGGSAAAFYILRRRKQAAARQAVVDELGFDTNETVPPFDEWTPQAQESLMASLREVGLTPVSMDVEEEPREIVPPDGVKTLSDVTFDSESFIGVKLESDPQILEDVEPVNIFADTPEWDMDFELAQRDDTAPYVIHKNEYFAEEMEWDNQSTLIYYSGDKILATESDEIIYDQDATVGELKFGHGSGDANVFYVRNHKRHVEYEVIKHSGRYEEEVLGLEVERDYEEKDIQHMHRPGKFRDV